MAKKAGTFVRHCSLIPFLLLLVLAQNAWSNIDAREFSDPEKLEAYQDLIRELRCPKCQNQDIADSDAPIARDMRQNVQELVEEGKSHDEVVDFMIERFGEFVTYKPRLKPETYLLWYGPWALVVFGFIIVLMVVRSKRQGASADSTVAHEGSGAIEKNPASAKPDMSKVDALLKKYEPDDSSNDKP